MIQLIRFVFFSSIKTYAVQTYFLKQDDLSILYFVFTKYFIGTSNTKYVIVDSIANFQEDLGSITIDVLIKLLCYMFINRDKLLQQSNLYYYDRTEKHSAFYWQ